MLVHVHTYAPLLTHFHKHTHTYSFTPSRTPSLLHAFTPSLTHTNTRTQRQLEIQALQARHVDKSLLRELPFNDYIKIRKRIGIYSLLFGGFPSFFTGIVGTAYACAAYIPNLIPDNPEQVEPIMLVCSETRLGLLPLFLPHRTCVFLLLLYLVLLSCSLAHLLLFFFVFFQLLVAGGWIR